MTDAASTPDVANWICPSCRAAHEDVHFCSQCGERRLKSHDQTLGDLLHQ